MLQSLFPCVPTEHYRARASCCCCSCCCDQACIFGATDMQQRRVSCRQRRNRLAYFLQPEEFRLGLGERRAGLRLWVCFARHTDRCMRTTGAVSSWPGVVGDKGPPHVHYFVVLYSIGVRVLGSPPARVGLEAGSIWQQCMPAAFGICLLAPLLGCCWHGASEGGEQKAGLVCCTQQPARPARRRQWLQEGEGFEGALRGCCRLAGRLLLGGCWIQRLRPAGCSIIGNRIGATVRSLSLWRASLIDPPTPHISAPYYRRAQEDAGRWLCQSRVGVACTIGVALVRRVSPSGAVSACSVITATSAEIILAARL